MLQPTISLVGNQRNSCLKWTLDIYPQIFVMARRKRRLMVSTLLKTTTQRKQVILSYILYVLLLEYLLASLNWHFLRQFLLLIYKLWNCDFYIRVSNHDFFFFLLFFSITIIMYILYCTINKINKENKVTEMRLTKVDLSLEEIFSWQPVEVGERNI